MSKETLREDFREVLEYLVKVTDADPTAYCWAVGKDDLYNLPFGSDTPVRSEGNFLYTTLKAMENRGLVRRRTKFEGMIRGPSTRYTVAYLTDKGRETLVADLAAKASSEDDKQHDRDNQRENKSVQ